MPRPKPPVVIPPDPQEGLNPLELAQLQQMALHDRFHPLHAMFSVDVAHGMMVRLSELLTSSPPEGYDLEQIKLGALSVAGVMQKISLWASLMELEPDRLKGNE